MAWRFPSWADVAKAIGYGYEEPKQLPQVGASSAPGAATFDPHASMAAFATFPWVRACVNAIADDFATSSGIDRDYRGSDCERLHECHRNALALTWEHADICSR